MELARKYLTLVDNSDLEKKIAKLAAKAELKGE